MSPLVRLRARRRRADAAASHRVNAELFTTAADLRTLAWQHAATGGVAAARPYLEEAELFEAAMSAPALS